MKQKLERLNEIEKYRNINNTVCKGDIVYLISELKRMYRLQEVLKRYIDSN